MGNGIFLIWLIIPQISDLRSLHIEFVDVEESELFTIKPADKEELEEFDHLLLSNLPASSFKDREQWDHSSKVTDLFTPDNHLSDMFKNTEETILTIS